MSRSLRVRQPGLPQAAAGHRLRGGEGRPVLRVLFREVSGAAVRQVQCQDQGEWCGAERRVPCVLTI